MCSVVRPEELGVRTIGDLGRRVCLRRSPCNVHFTYAITFTSNLSARSLMRTAKTVACNTLIDLLRATKYVLLRHGITLSPIATVSRRTSKCSKATAIYAVDRADFGARPEASSLVRHRAILTHLRCVVVNGHCPPPKTRHRHCPLPKSLKNRRRGR